MDKVLIGIPTLNGPNRLEDCLNAIYRTHDIHERSRYEPMLVVLDDGSSPENLAENKKICGRRNVSLIIHRKNMGVAKSWNDLIHAAESDYCILLNDDVMVSEHWIYTVLYTLQNNSQIGVVGLNAYEGVYSKLPTNNVPTYVESTILLGSKFSPILSARGFAFGFRKNDYISIGGFSDQYYCFFEEIDFNLKMMTMLQKRNCILSYPILKHTHGATTFAELKDPSSVFNSSKESFEKTWNMKWPNDLRTRFTKNTILQINKDELNEWNSNIAIWG